jgi:hypothetical protein
MYCNYSPTSSRADLPPNKTLKTFKNLQVITRGNPFFSWRELGRTTPNCQKSISFRGLIPGTRQKSALIIAHLVWCFF